MPINVKDKKLVKPIYISPLPSPILKKSPKEVNKISKYFKKNPPSAQKKSYAQISSKLTTSNIAIETLKIKEVFPNLQNKKIEQVQKLISSNSKSKPHINMTMKRPLCKQVIVPMNIDNTRKFLKDFSTHIININRALKNIKLNIMADFIRIDDKGIVISINNVASPSDLQEIEEYFKNSSCVEANQIDAPRLPQFKLYLKIVGIPYLSKQSNSCLSSDKVEKILKGNHIFNNIILAFKPRIIKVFSKSDMSIVWIDIWDMQSGIKAKSLINRRFNVGSFITTIHSANMNSSVPQCKNYWKWDHTAGVCRIQGSKCVKCNGFHQSIHHHQFA